MDDRELRPGFVRLHILLNTADASIYGQWIMEELAHHGYRLSADTLYPMLHAMEKKGCLASHEERHGRAVRRLYVATDLGREALAVARDRARELFGEWSRGMSMNARWGLNAKERRGGVRRKSDVF